MNRSPWILLLVTLVALSAMSGCSKVDTSTQITVAFASETEIPKELNQIEVVVIDARGSEVSRIVYDVPKPGFFPATLAVIPKAESSLDGPVAVEVRGQLRKSNGQIITAVLRRAVISYVEGRNLLLPMPLRMACFTLDYCGANETCAGGTCQPAQVDPSTLVDFEERVVFGAAAGSSCFDEGVCLASSVQVPLADTGNPEVCEFDLPPGVQSGPDGKPQVNISIQWAAAPERIIGLDEGDDIEGWTLISATRGRLSKGVCLSLRDAVDGQGKRLVPDEALGVFVSTQCPAKGKLQPFCTGAGGQVGIGRNIQ